MTSQVYIVFDASNLECDCLGTVHKIFFSRDEAEKEAEHWYGAQVTGPYSIEEKAVIKEEFK